MDKEDEKIWDEYNMDDYDDEPDDIAVNIGKFIINKIIIWLVRGALIYQLFNFMSYLGSLVVPQNENEYHDDENGEAADEDDEDITLKENDHVLLAGIDSPDGTANIEVRFLDENTGNSSPEREYGVNQSFKVVEVLKSLT